MRNRTTSPEKSPETPGTSGIYEIRLQGHLDPGWASWFGELAIILAENGDTLLRGRVADQATLHGLLRKVRDLNLPLLSVMRLASGREETFNVQQ